MLQVWWSSFASSCKCKDLDCLICKKKGHIPRVCKSKKLDSSCQKSSSKSYFVSEQEQTTGNYSYDMFVARNSSTEPIIVNVHLNQVPVTMELDTGVSHSIINKDTYSHINTVATTPITKSSVKITYIGVSIPNIGSINIV